MIEFISRLPQGYQEVEYIESSGTQYIDTGFKPNQDTRVVCDIDYTLTSATAWLFGARTASQDRTYNVLAYASQYRSDYNNVTTGAESSANPSGRFTLDKDKNVTRFNGVAGATLTYAAFQCEYTLYLFANNNAGAAAGHGTFKMYACQIYDNGNLIRDFVPCYRKPDNVTGLYDLVNDTFYTNAGTANFARGKNSNTRANAVITPGGVISMQCALRRRMMIKYNSKFEFEYTGNYTDNRDENGIGTVRFISSGTLTVLSGKNTVSAYILGAGGGGVYQSSGYRSASGGGGGFQTVDVELSSGIYEIVIGAGGEGKYSKNAASSNVGGTGGPTTAFGYTSTGGTGGGTNGTDNGTFAGQGGSPNGNSGSVGLGKSGGSPNGGGSKAQNAAQNSGGNGYVEITFS